MNAEKKSVVALCLLVIAEYALGGLVTFSDAPDAGFQLNTFATSWPGVLATIHRIFAVVLIVLWILLSLPLRGTRAFTASHLTLGLIVVQSVIGIFIPLTLGSPVNSYVVIVHFSVSALIIAATAFTAVLGWLLEDDRAKQRGRMPQEEKRRA